MTTLELEEKSLIITISSHWDEMSAKNIYYCLGQVILAASGHQTAAQCQVSCFYRLAGVKRDWRSVIWEYIMPADMVMEKNANATAISRQTMSFLFSPPSEGSKSPIEINYNTIFNHFPSIKTPFSLKTFSKTTLHGPADLLSDLTFAEFRTAIEEMNDYFKDRSEHNLSRMIACLYRPQRKGYRQLSRSEHFDGYRRQPFNRTLIETNALKIDRLHPVYRTAILLWFTYTIHYIQTEDLVISGQTINLSPLFPKKDKETTGPAKQSASGSGWTPILYHIAKEGIFGNTEATDRTGLFDILLYMYANYMEAKRIKSKSKN